MAVDRKARQRQQQTKTPKGGVLREGAGGVAPDAELAPALTVAPDSHDRANQQHKGNAAEEPVQQADEIRGPATHERIVLEVAEIGTKRVVNTQAERFGAPANPELH